MKCWVLFKTWSDSPGAEIVRAYLVHDAALQDFELISGETVMGTYQLAEVLFYPRESSENES